MSRGNARVDEDKVDVSTETKSERRKGKKDINLRWKKFRAPGGTRTCVDTNVASIGQPVCKSKLNNFVLPLSLAIAQW